MVTAGELHDLYCAKHSLCQATVSSSVTLNYADIVCTVRQQNSSVALAYLLEG